MSANRLAAVLVGALVLGAGLATPAAAGAPTQSTAPALVVEVATDGSAVLTLRLTYDLDGDDERAAFDSLRNDTDALDRTESAFRSRMAAVAADVSNRTGRDVRVTSADVSVSTTGSTGVVSLSATWSALAAVEGERIVLSEPFASGFAPERRFSVVGPEGYAPVEISPTPAEVDGAAATWANGTDLTGFSVTFAPAGSAGEATDDADGRGDGIATPGQPGFGPLVALAAVVTGGLAVARHRRR